MCIEQGCAFSRIGYAVSLGAARGLGQEGASKQTLEVECQVKMSLSEGAYQGQNLLGGVKILAVKEDEPVEFRMILKQWCKLRTYEPGDMSLLKMGAQGMQGRQGQHRDQL